MCRGAVLVIRGVLYYLFVPCSFVCAGILGIVLDVSANQGEHPVRSAELPVCLLFRFFCFDREIFIESIYSFI